MLLYIECLEDFDMYCLVVNTWHIYYISLIKWYILISTRCLLLTLHKKEFFFLQDLIDRYHPTCLAIETQFVDKNPQTMIKIVHAQGVAIAAALSKDLPIYEYSPMKIKMAITGNGHSTKQQVADMLIRFLKLDVSVDGGRLSDGTPLDATDALGIAYCHFLQLGLPFSSEHGAKNWTQYAKQRGLTGTSAATPNQKLMAALSSRK